MSTDTPATYPNKVVITTETRQELFDACAMLAQGIDEAVLRDPENPLVIRIDGGWNCGKTAVADALRRTLMSSASLFGYRGNKGFDEYWTADIKGTDGKTHTIEIDFINIEKRYGYSVQELVDYSHRVPENDTYQKFARQRTVGGVSFVHNAPHVDVSAFGLDVNFDYTENHSEALPWARKMEIDIRDPRLALSPKFMQAVEDVRQGKHRAVDPYDVRMAFAAAIKERLAFSVDQVKRSVYPKAG